MNQIDPERQAEFDDLLAGCLRSYLPTPVGQEHRRAYAVLRQAARTHYAAVAQLAPPAGTLPGPAFVDAVLWKLLPYTDSALHRSQGAWVHLAPAITGDLRTWHEAAGWAQPDGWPAVAQAIWRFIRRAVEAPIDLADACAEFAALPYTKGFQTGMLTPILNALRPEDFLLFHPKSRAALGYFTRTAWSQALADYPATNRALHALLAGQTTLQAEAAALEMLPGDLFDLFCQWLGGVRRFAFRPVRYWRMAITEDTDVWATWRAGSYVALGWEELGDLTGIARREFEARRASLLAQYPERTKAGGQAVWRFARQLAEGDRVLVADAAGTVLGVGTIAGPYYYVPDLELGHRRPVEWEDLTPRLAGRGSLLPLVEVTRTVFDDAARAPAAALPPVPATSPTTPAAPRLAEPAAPYAAAQPAYSLADCAADTGLDVELLARWMQAVERKGQAILYGPPGTGKTFVAQRLAQHLAGGSDGFVELVQFHPAYTYEDFVQGIRPLSQGGALSYAMVPGRFLDFCRRAVSRAGRCVLVIDEINRANLAQVLGELMYLLEYREATVLLAGDNTPFAIPANVRLLGTMNTADRSLALVDHALRRRFAFLALYPDLEVLRGYHARAATGFPVEPLAALLTRVNAAIGDRNYALGITYFLRPDLAHVLGDIWQTEVEPYLEELFFDRPEQVEPFRWPAVRGALGL